MKRSEIIRRVNDGMNTHPHRIFPPARFELGDDNCVAVAEALGVTVEPDEPPLPDRLEMAMGGEMQGGYAESTVDGVLILVRGLADNRADRALLNALVAAYNDRPPPFHLPRFEPALGYLGRRLTEEKGKP